MNKIWIIFRQEYLNIVRKPAFLLGTFLVPLGFAAIFVIQIAATLNVEKENYKVLIPQQSLPEITARLTPAENLTFEASPLSEQELIRQAAGDETLIVMTLSEALKDKKAGTVTFYNNQNLAKPVVSQLEKKVKEAVQGYKNEVNGITADKVEAAKFELAVQTEKLNEKTGQIEESSENIATGVGFAMSFIMYMLMAIYGSILMQSIIDEKSNRVVEVIVSSAEPFQMLLGKTLAIASVGITQFVLWTLTTFLILTGLSVFTAGMVDPAAMQQPGVDTAQAMSMVEGILVEAQNFNWGMLLWAFPLYFLGGFFLYGSLLAAAGSAVDNIQDAQQFTTPIMLPLIVPMLFIYNIIQNPNSLLAFVFSFIPFFSPMTMLIRLSMSAVPWYEVLISLLLLIGTFLGCIWIAGKIYRTGILMYGKKPTFKELFRWVMFKG
ncbi:MAG: ABC transporter permease [Bacteroidia bacterium]|nr:ABC transporter permease [Bacteroidia bacterium]